MEVGLIFLILPAVLVTISGTTVNNVRLVDHDTYIISVIQETLKEVEKLEWCNLKVNDVSLDLEEDVLGNNVMGHVEYTNGFVVSIQWVDILGTSVRQLWRFDRVDNTTRVEVHGTLRMHAVTLGFDVLANMADGEERYTATFVHPILPVDFLVTKDMFSEEIVVTVAVTVPRNTNAPRFIPNTRHSQAFASLYDWNSTTIGIRGWGPDIFQPIASKLVLEEIPFPRVCYNCRV